MDKHFEIAGHRVAQGTREYFELPVARLVTQNMVHLPVAVVQGRRPGPRLFVTAAIHGDEINGTEIARRVLDRVQPDKLTGTLLVVPVVNVLGFIQGSRYLPDRRDLNRSFPGSAKGSLASQLAHLVMQEVVARCTHGLDLHGGSHHRTNLPQVRGDLDLPGVRELCDAFAPPLIMHSKCRAGSMRASAARAGIPLIIYEAGEPQRFEDTAIQVGVSGVLRVMARLGMLRLSSKPRRAPLVSRKSTWVRASRSGIARLKTTCGNRVAKGDVLAEIGDTFGRIARVEKARAPGLVIGQTLNPIVNRGDAMVHIAAIEDEDQT